VVDDDPIIRNLALEVLREEGYRVVGAGSGEEAVRAARRQSFDLAVLDWKMSGMNGIETFRALRGFRPSLAGLMITGYGSPDLLERARDEGITEFLMKPFTLQSLAEAVGRLSTTHAAGGPSPRPQSRAATPSRLR
jgi:CheY-like chemotaxis protein